MANGTDHSGIYISVGAASLIGAGLAAYHGNKRNNGDVFYTVVWGIAGGLLPVFTIPYALGQGFADPAPASARANPTLPSGRRGLARY